MHLVNQKKQQAWKDFCSNVESANDISNVLRALEGKYNRDMSLLKDNNSNFNPEEAENSIKDPFSGPPGVPGSGPA